MVKRKLPPRSGSSLEAVEPHPQKGAIKFFLKDFNYFMYFIMTITFGVPSVKSSLKIKMKAVLSAIRTSNI